MPISCKIAAFICSAGSRLSSIVEQPGCVNELERLKIEHAGRSGTAAMWHRLPVCTERLLRVACESGDDVVVSQSRDSIGAEHRLEAYATLRLGLASPDRAVLDLK